MKASAGPYSLISITRTRAVVTMSTPQYSTSAAPPPTPPKTSDRSHSSSSSSSSSSWQPPSIPNSVSSSLQSWFRPGHHHHHNDRHSSDKKGGRSGSKDSSSSASSSSSGDSAGGSGGATPSSVTTTAAGAAERAHAQLPRDNPALKAPVRLQYMGRFDELAAQAELYLYMLSTPYFKGAQIGNVFNPLLRGDRVAFEDMWKDSASSVMDANRRKGYPAEWRATMGTRRHTDGKVGSIRWVSVDPLRATNDQAGTTQNAAATAAEQHPPPAASSWLSSPWLSWITGVEENRPKNALNVLEIGKPSLQGAEDGDEEYSSERRSENREKLAAHMETQEPEEKIVLLHGYGAGTGFFFQNIASLAARPNSRLYAIDWLGMGRSSRPTFQIPQEAMASDLSRVQAAESFFVESLEEWRKRAGVEKMKLIGHSLGGYLSVAYTLRYPQRVSRLILVSPAGAGQAPHQRGPKSSNLQSTFSAKNGDYIPEEARGDVDADALSVHSVEREVMESQQETIRSEQDGPAADREGAGSTTGLPTTSASASAAASRPASVAEAAASVADGRAASRPSSIDTPSSTTPPKAKTSSSSEAEQEGVKEGEKPRPRISPRKQAFFSWLWERNFSPFGLLRGSQFLGPWLTSRYTTRRFGALPEDELKALHAYCQGIFLAKGSGEYSLSHILLPAAWARVPLIDRIAPLSKTLPVSFVYGETDWMDVKSGKDIVKKLREEGQNPLGSCYVVAHAGHHVYLDNPKVYNRLIEKILDGRAERRPQRAPDSTEKEAPKAATVAPGEDRTTTPSPSPSPPPQQQQQTEAPQLHDVSLSFATARGSSEDGAGDLEFGLDGREAREAGEEEGVDRVS